MSETSKLKSYSKSVNSLIILTTLDLSDFKIGIVI